MAGPLDGIRVVVFSTMISGPLATMILGDLPPQQALGREVFFERVERADVFVQNFRPGTTDRMGIGEAALRELNPQLVYVSISDFGEKGSYVHKRVYDPLIQAISGLPAFWEIAEWGGRARCGSSCPTR